MVGFRTIWSLWPELFALNAKMRRNRRYSTKPISTIVSLWDILISLGEILLNHKLDALVRKVVQEKMQKTSVALEELQEDHKELEIMVTQFETPFEENVKKTEKVLSEN